MGTSGCTYPFGFAGDNCLHCLSTADPVTYCTLAKMWRNASQQIPTNRSAPVFCPSIVCIISTDAACAHTNAYWTWTMLQNAPGTLDKGIPWTTVARKKFPNPQRHGRRDRRLCVGRTTFTLVIHPCCGTWVNNSSGQFSWPLHRMQPPERGLAPSSDTAFAVGWLSTSACSGWSCPASLLPLVCRVCWGLVCLSSTRLSSTAPSPSLHTVLRAGLMSAKGHWSHFLLLLTSGS